MADRNMFHHTTVLGPPSLNTFGSLAHFKSTELFGFEFPCQVVSAAPSTLPRKIVTVTRIILSHADVVGGENQNHNLQSKIYMQYSLQGSGVSGSQGWNGCHSRDGNASKEGNLWSRFGRRIATKFHLIKTRYTNKVCQILLLLLTVTVTGNW